MSHDYTDLIARLRECSAIHQLPHAAADALASQDAEIAQLRAERDAAVADAERYRWLAPRLFAVDFDYGGEGVSAVVFEWTQGASIGADLDGSIDAARQPTAHDPNLKG